MSNTPHKVEVAIGLNTLLAVEVEVSDFEGEPNWDEAQKLALQRAREVFLAWLENPDNPVSFDISDCNKIED